MRPFRDLRPPVFAAAQPALASADLPLKPKEKLTEQPVKEKKEGEPLPTSVNGIVKAIDAGQRTHDLPWHRRPGFYWKWGVLNRSRRAQHE